MKILCVTKNKAKLNCHELWKKDLCKHADVYFCGKSYPDCDLASKIKEHDVDCLLVCGLPTRDYLYRDFSKLDVFKVNILTDYNIFKDGSTYTEYDSFLQRNNFDLLLCYNGVSLNHLADRYRVKLTKLSVSPSKYKTDVKDVDIMSSGSTNVRFYNGRKELNRFLKSIKQVSVITKMMEFENYVKYLGKSKIFVHAGNNFKTNCVSLKYLESMVSDTLFITSAPVNLEEYGFVDGKHLVLYNNFNDLEEKIMYYLNNECERKKIVMNAMTYVLDNFTNGIVIQNMIRDIEKCKKS